MPNVGYNASAMNQGMQTLAQGLYDNGRSQDLGSLRAMQQQLLQERSGKAAVDAEAARFDLQQKQAAEAGIADVVKGFMEAFGQYTPQRIIPESTVQGMVPNPPRGNPITNPSLYNEETGQIAGMEPDVPVGELIPGVGYSAPVQKPMMSPAGLNGIIEGAVRGGKIGDVPKTIADTFATMLGLTGEEKAAYMAHVLRGGAPVSNYQAFTPEGVVNAEQRKLKDTTTQKELELNGKKQLLDQREAGLNERQLKSLDQKEKHSQRVSAVQLYGIDTNAATSENNAMTRADTADKDRAANGGGPKLPNRPQDVYATRMMIEKVIHSKLGTTGEVPEKIMGSVYAVMKQLMEQNGDDMGTAIKEAVDAHPGLKDTAFTSGGKVGGDATVDQKKIPAPTQAAPAPARSFTPKPMPQRPDIGGPAPAAAPAPATPQSQTNPEIQRGLDLLNRLEASNDPDKAAKIAKAKSVLKSLGWSE